MAGIKETKELVVFVGALVSAVDKSTQDGMGMDDVALFVDSMMKAPAAFAGLAEMKLEVAELSQEELKELVDAMGVALDLVNDDLELLVEKALAIALEIYAIVEQVKVLKA